MFVISVSKINESKTIVFPVHFRPIVKFKQEGNELPSETNCGDIIINIYPKKHKHFKIINDYDLLIKIEISVYEAINGSIFNVPYLNGEHIMIRTQKNIYQNMIQKINNLGLPIPWTDKYGNLYVKFILKIENIELNIEKNRFAPRS